MSEGRSELEKVIEVWERRHVAAVQAKNEAEVVMPFLRAAIEELDSFHAGNKTIAGAAVDFAPQATDSEVVERTDPPAFEGDFGSTEDDVAAEPTGDDAPTEFPNVFQRRGIASLMDDEDTDNEAAAV